MNTHNYDQEEINMKSREHAENLVKYFERIAREEDQEVWWKGLSTAQEWLRLIDTENLSQAELSTFIDVVHAIGTERAVGLIWR